MYCLQSKPKTIHCFLSLPPHRCANPSPSDFNPLFSIIPSSNARTYIAPSAFSGHRMAAPNGSSGVPPPDSSYIDKGYGVNSTPKSHLATAEDFAPPQIYSRFTEDWDASVRGESIIDGSAMQQPNSAMLQAESQMPSRGGTLKKKASLKKGSSLRRSGSRRSSRAGSVSSTYLRNNKPREVRGCRTCFVRSPRRQNKYHHAIPSKE